MCFGSLMHMGYRKAVPPVNYGVQWMGHDIVPNPEDIETDH